MEDTTTRLEAIASRNKSKETKNNAPLRSFHHQNHRQERFGPVATCYPCGPVATCFHRSAAVGRDAKLWYVLVRTRRRDVAREGSGFVEEPKRRHLVQNLATLLWLQVPVPKAPVPASCSVATHPQTRSYGWGRYMH